MRICFSYYTKIISWINCTGEVTACEATIAASPDEQLVQSKE